MEGVREPRERFRSASEPPPENPCILCEDEEGAKKGHVHPLVETAFSDWDDECSICMCTFAEPFKDDPRATEEYMMEQIWCLPCRHYFHYRCIYLWLLRNRSCPICCWTPLPRIVE